MADKLPTQYSEGSIRVLKGLEPVKQRPGMYTRTDNPLHIIQEVLDKEPLRCVQSRGSLNCRQKMTVIGIRRYQR